MATDPGVVAAFGGGMLSFLSPCVLPLVPGYLSLISGVSVAELQEGGVATATRVIRPTLLFILGFTLVFTALGAGASALGEVLNDHQNGLNQIAGVLVVIMGLFLAGVVSPRVLMAERRMHVSPSQLGGWAPPVMGMAFAFGWSPCIGPILGGVIGLAQNEETLSRGALLLVVYSLGLGVPFLITGLAMSRLAGLFGWVKRHHRAINLVAGLALVAFGMLLITNRVFWLSLRIQDFMERVNLDRLARI
jgi:cytochrome c-type biogenesis protein